MQTTRPTHPAEDRPEAAGPKVPAAELRPVRQGEAHSRDSRSEQERTVCQVVPHLAQVEHPVPRRLAQVARREQGQGRGQEQAPERVAAVRAAGPGRHRKRREA